LGKQVEALNASGAKDLELIGNRSHNWITGNHGNNHILGEAGNDRLVGNAGDDLLVGGTGNDVLEGGSGRDVFSFRPGDGIDVIKDFDVGTDLLLLEVIADVTVINATESASGVLIHFGAPGDLIVLNGLTRESVEMRSVFTEQAHWTLDF
jgi:Ca2+-binding RTX toxin-like protein